MPLPLVPLLPLALRVGAAATAGYAALRWLRAATHPGRTDQRAEDALDALDEGLALHRPADLADDRQTNASARMIRVVRFRGQVWEVDASLMARLRLRRRME